MLCEEEEWTFVVVQQSGQQGLSLWLKLFADGGASDQLLVLLKHLQQLSNKQAPVGTQGEFLPFHKHWYTVLYSVLYLDLIVCFTTCCGLSCTSAMWLFSLPATSCSDGDISRSNWATAALQRGLKKSNKEPQSLEILSHFGWGWLRNTWGLTLPLCRGYNAEDWAQRRVRRLGLTSEPAASLPGAEVAAFHGPCAVLLPEKHR